MSFSKAHGSEGAGLVVRPKLVTDDTIVEIAKLRRTGLSIRKVAAQIGFSKATVQKALVGNA